MISIVVAASITLDRIDILKKQGVSSSILLGKIYSFWLISFACILSIFLLKMALLNNFCIILVTNVIYFSL